MLGKYVKEQDIKKILDNNYESRENLIQHKQLLNEVIGQLNTMTDLYKEAVFWEEKTNQIASKVLYDWEAIKNDESLVARLDAIPVEPIIKADKNNPWYQFLKATD